MAFTIAMDNRQAIFEFWIVQVEFVCDCQHGGIKLS